MPTVTTDGTALYYDVSGDEGPAVVFVSNTGFGPWSWGWQAPQLSGMYRTVVYANRGTDGSDIGLPYSIDQFAADLEAVLEAADIRRVHVVGAGLGAMVALRYAREYNRARSLTLFGATASGEAVDDSALRSLHPSDATQFRASLSLAFSERFLEETGLIDKIVEWRRNEDATGAAADGHRELVSGFESAPLYELTIPVLVCHGVDDPVVSIDAGRELAADLPRGRFEAVEGKRCCYIEHSTAVSDAIDQFIDSVISS